MKNVEIISELVKNGAVRVNNLKVTNVTVTPFESYVRLGIRIDSEVDGYVADENGVMSLGKTDLIFLSTFAVSSVMRDDDELATIVDHIIANPNAFKLIMQGAKIDIIQQKVAKDDEYINPFASVKTPTKMPNNTVINHIAAIILAPSAKKWVEKIQNSMLGIN